eukprot:scaffold27080_cov234-Skeletonema_menzelii.AAC.3
MVKHSCGGTSIYKHWYPDVGEFWPGLQQTIRARRTPGGKNNWKGLIWHQGTQEVWSEKKLGEDRSLTYYGNMTDLISQLRQEMYTASDPGTWQCKEEIPVIVVQIGYWPHRSDAAQRVRDAQTEYCSNDPRSQLVPTSDLSRNFHYDAASFLVSGNRIAHAYREALKGEVVCPETSQQQHQQQQQQKAISSSYQPSSSTMSSQPSSRPSTVISIVTPTTIHPSGDEPSATGNEAKR